jgi:hypothetical protein
MRSKSILPKLPAKLFILTLLLILVIFLDFRLKTIGQASSDSFVAWASESLNRIAPTAPGGSTKNIKLFAARGEYESFQIGIKASSSQLTNVNVSVSDFSNSNNQVIPKSNISLYREHYVPVNHSSPIGQGSPNSPLPTGLYPDALIPFTNPQTGNDLEGAQLNAVPFNLKIGNNQPIWVDIFVPRNAQPGDYAAEYVITSDQGKLSGNISLKVWNFELPLKPSLNSEFGLYDTKDKSSLQEMLKHKIMPGSNFDPAYQRELIDRWGLKSLRLPYWSGADDENRTMTLPPSVSEIKQKVSEYQSDVLLYARYADEIDGSSELIEPMKQWARNFHNAGVSTTIVMTPIPELYDDGSGSGRSVVDNWVVSPIKYDQNSNEISKVLSKGDKVWFYTALTPDNYSPKWQLDFEPINFRIPHGFINQSLGLTGVLYWRVNEWDGDPWKDEQVVFHQNNYFPGEGMLVYPGAKVGVEGVVPSMRLKWIRDGVEDYEYIEILKQKGRGDWALGISRQAGKDWTNWTQDSSVLESVRQKLGAEIERIS